MTPWDRNVLTVEMTAVINGHECHYWLQIQRERWEWPEAKLAYLKMMKAKMLDRALAGLEPVVTVHEGPMPTHVGAPLESASDGSGHFATVEAR